MPLIDFTLPAGAIAPDRRAELVDSMTETLLRREGAPDNEFFRSIAWVHVHELPGDAVYVGGAPATQPTFRVEVTIPQGALSDRRKAGLVEDLTKLVLEAAGLGEDAGLRIWVLIHEVPDGNWAGAGRIVRFADLRAAAQQSREPAPAAS